MTKATPVVTWSNPAPITVGTPLSGTQLNASSGGVLGTFEYTPPDGTVLTLGSQTLSVQFTPDDLSTYEIPAVKEVTINVMVVVSFTETLMNTTNSATGLEIQNDGTLIRAYRIGETGTITVNGLTFQGAAGAGNDSALSGTWGGSGYLDQWVNSAISDTNYLHLTGCLVQAPADTTGTKPTLTIGGLTPGNTYRLQLFSNSPRGGQAEVEGNTHTMQNLEKKFVKLTATWTAADATLNMRWISQATAGMPVHFSAYALHDITGVGGSDYATWTSNPAYSGFDLSNPIADADGDGMSNHDEYAFGLNPTTGTSVNPVTDISVLSGLGKFTYTRTADTSTALAYTVWVSTDLADWGTAPAAATQTPRVPVLDGVETVDVTLDDYAPPLGGKLFVRVQAE